MICTGTTLKKTPCAYRAKAGSDFCGIHAPKTAAAEHTTCPMICTGTPKKTPCAYRAKAGSDFCGLNTPNAECEDCPICFVRITRTSVKKQLSCDHTFHRKCIDKWLRDRSTCPMCRRQVRQPLTHVFYVDEPPGYQTSAFFRWLTGTLRRVLPTMEEREITRLALHADFNEVVRLIGGSESLMHVYVDNPPGTRRPHFVGG